MVLKMWFVDITFRHKFDNAVADQGFLRRWGRQPCGGANRRFAKLSQKLHEVWGESWEFGRPSRRPKIRQCNVKGIHFHKCSFYTYLSIENVVFHWIWIGNANYKPRYTNMHSKLFVKLPTEKKVREKSKSDTFLKNWLKHYGSCLIKL